MPSVLKWMSKRDQKKMDIDWLMEDDPSLDQGDILSVFDVPYVSQEGVSLKMDIYRPALPSDSDSASDTGNDENEDTANKNLTKHTKNSPLLPVIIIVHGGGMMVGHPRMEKAVCQRLAKRGFLVFAPGYRLITEADGFGELCDVTAGLDYAASVLKKYGGDPDKVFLMGESAGGWLSLYAASMIRSDRIRSLMPFAPAHIRIRGIIFVSGMFYTLKKDLIGLVYPKDLYGEKSKDPSFLEYMNPEHEEIINNLPPVILTSSRGDFLRKYTLNYAKALRKAGHKYKLLYYPDNKKELIHAFVTLHPELPESQDALDKICRLIK